ncbi:MAG: glycine--tRNA ligase subunit alpha [Acidobacteria bacterium]|nr:glycine--tRNA ligase subunit alpha [Acidobacteriota bacterium]MBI3658020.1 glycine--tRNA ligase subunit alpha [Acidobacteriota bacterium]
MGCVIQQPYDVEVGAGTMHPETFLRVLGPEPYRVAYIQPSRRPADGRYGDNPNRVQKHYQLQVILKPSAADVQDLYLASLKAVGIDLRQHDLRFEEDNWESPTLGAWGIGWQILLDGLEITQFTYFQQAGGIDLQPISAEITYGLERLATFIANVDSIYDIPWSPSVTYGEVRQQEEVEFSRYNFEEASREPLFEAFKAYEAESGKALVAGLVLPAYDYCLKCSHTFNLMDARGFISVTERVGIIGRVRKLACAIAEAYLESRKAMGYPLCKAAPDRGHRNKASRLPDAEMAPKLP